LAEAAAGVVSGVHEPVLRFFGGIAETVESYLGLGEGG